MKNDPFDLETLRIGPGQIAERVAMVPRKIQKRRAQFAMLPMSWYERMRGARGQTYRVAWHLLYLHWKTKGDRIKLANGMLAFDGVPRTSKWRALGDLEDRGLITIDRQRRKSPIIRVLFDPVDGTV